MRAPACARLCAPPRRDPCPPRRRPTGGRADAPRRRGARKKFIPGRLSAVPKAQNFSGSAAGHHGPETIRAAPCNARPDRRRPCGHPCFWRDGAPPPPLPPRPRAGRPAPPRFPPPSPCTNVTDPARPCRERPATGCRTDPPWPRSRRGRARPPRPWRRRRPTVCVICAT